MNLLNIIFNRNKNYPTKKEELIILGVTILLSVVAHTDIAVHIFYNEYIAGIFSETFPFFRDYSALYSGDKRKPLLFLMGMVLFFPFIVFLLYKRFNIGCVKVKSRPIGYGAFFLLFIPFMFYVLFLQVTEPFTNRDGLLLFHAIINFSLKSSVHMGLVFFGYAVFAGLLLITPIKFLFCLYEKNT